MASEVERQRGLAHAGPAGDDVEAPWQEPGAEPVPAREAGGEAAEGLTVSLFERQEEPVYDIAGCLPAPTGSMAQEPISGGADIGQELMDRAGRGGCLQESALHVHDQVAADAALLDHVGIPVEPAEVRQVEVEGGEIGQAADLLQASRLLEVGLQGEEVGSGARVREMEDGLVQPPMALEVQVARLQAGADLCNARRIQQE